MNAQRIQGTDGQIDADTPQFTRNQSLNHAPKFPLGSTSLHFPVLSLSCRPNQVAEKVAARISENFSDAAIVMVSVNLLGWCSWTALLV